MSQDEKLVPKVDLYPGGFVGKVVGKTTLGATRLLYTCNHRHRNGDNALSCALKNLRRYEKNFNATLKENRS